MDKEEKLSREEISRRIVTGMGLVYDLFNEMNSFFRSLLDALESSDLDILPRKHKFNLPKPKSRKLRTPADDYLRTDMGLIAEIGVSGADYEEAADIEENQEGDLDEKVLSITPDSQFLAVRAILYDADKVNAGSFEPFVVGTVLSSFKRSPKRQKGGKAEKHRKFQLKKGGMLFRGMSQLEPSLEKGKEISWKIPKYEISATVSEIVKKPLVEFDTEESFNEFVQDLISMAESA